MKLIVLLSILFFGLLTQTVYILNTRNSLKKKELKWILITLYIETLIAIALLLSVYFEIGSFWQYTFVYLVCASSVLFIEVYMTILNSGRVKERRIVLAVLLVLMLGLVYLTPHLEVYGFMSILITTIGALAFLFFSGQKFKSTKLKWLSVALGGTEALRALILGFILFAVVHFEIDAYIWLASMHYVLKITVVMIVAESKPYTIIPSRLAQVYDKQDASRLFHLISKHSISAILLTDMEKNIVYINEKALELIGYTLDEVIGKTPRIFASGKTSKEVYDSMRSAITKYQDWTGEFINKRKDNSIFIEEVNIVTLFDVDNNPIFYLGIKKDITKEKEYLNKLEYNSTHDQLTGLLLRHAFIEKIEKLRSKKTGIFYFALFDVDQFKRINDEYGHYIGDKALMHISDICRKIFTGDSIVCRFGGDEFGIFIPSEGSNVSNLIDELHTELEVNPYVSNGISISLEISVGVSKMRTDDVFNTIYESADVALYHAKNKRKKTVFSGDF